MGKDGQIRVGPRELSPLQRYRKIHKKKEEIFYCKIWVPGAPGFRPLKLPYVSIGYVIFKKGKELVS